MPSEPKGQLLTPVPQPSAGTVPSEKRRYVRQIFSAIAPRYDLLNRVLSLNIDRSWRRRALGRLEWQARPSGTYLDACAGTLDLAAMLADDRRFSGRVVGADFAIPMLRLGAGKSKSGRVIRAGADTLVLPFPDSTFDGATVGFGVRNLADLDRGLAELARVLKPGARLVVLDITTPSSSVLRPLYLLYFKHVLPVVGRLVSGHPTAYSYLPDSVMGFPQPEELAQRMTAAGLHDCGFERLSGGIASLSWGTK